MIFKEKKLFFDKMGNPKNLEILERKMDYCETKISSSIYPKLLVHKLIRNHKKGHSGIKFVNLLSLFLICR